MKKSLLASVTLAAMLAPTAVFADGFGIIEYSAEGVAMGGAAMFVENSAGNMGYNPVGITLCHGEQIQVNGTYISPHGYSKVETKPTVNPTDTTQVLRGSEWVNCDHNRVHPAWAPGAYYVRQVSDKEWYGLGCFARFGNKSEFYPGSLPATNNRYANMKGISITPTYARRSGRKFYWAVGADINYVGLELQKNFDNGMGAGPAVIPVPMGNNKTEGETWALGWNVGLRYAPTAKDEIGFAYRSKIAHTMDADFDWYGINAGVASTLFGAPITEFHSRAHGKVTLPDSYHFGYSHKFDNKNRVEIGAIRTQWHNFKNLDMHIDGFKTISSAHNWKDNWRYAIGYEHKFSKKYTGMLGFAFDDEAKQYDGGDFMVPIGIHRTYSAGIKYEDKRHTIVFTYAYQIEGDTHFGTNYETDAYQKAFSHDNIAKIFSIGYTYHF